MPSTRNPKHPSPALTGIPSSYPQLHPCSLLPSSLPRPHSPPWKSPQSPFLTPVNPIGIPATIRLSLWIISSTCSLSAPAMCPPLLHASPSLVVTSHAGTPLAQQQMEHQESRQDGRRLVARTRSTFLSSSCNTAEMSRWHHSCPKGTPTIRLQAEQGSVRPATMAPVSES